MEERERERKGGKVEERNEKMKEGDGERGKKRGKRKW